MNIEEAKILVTKLTKEKQELMRRLEIPARAAYNAMKDAGMSRSADPLGQVLFELDAKEQEMNKFTGENLELFLEVIIAMLNKTGA